MNIINTATEDKLLAEAAVFEAIEFLRSKEPSIAKHRNRYRKRLTNELEYLRQNHPDSDMLDLNISDISLTIEKE